MSLRPFLVPWVRWGLWLLHFLGIVLKLAAKKFPSGLLDSLICISFACFSMALVGLGRVLGTWGLGRVDKLPGYKFTTHYQNANYITYKKKKEFQANRWKFNVIGFYKLSLHLAKPLLYTITQTFLHFQTHPMHTCSKDRQADATYYFHSNVLFSNCGHVQNAMVTGTRG